MTDIEAAWMHLKARDGWAKPSGVSDAQVLLMTTCMETWIIVDRAALARHYGQRLQTSLLPPLANVETRTRDDVQTRLANATKRCSNAYAKGKRSFEVLGQLNPGGTQAAPIQLCPCVEDSEQQIVSAAETRFSSSLELRKLKPGALGENNWAIKRSTPELDVTHAPAGERRARRSRSSVATARGARQSAFGLAGLEFSGIGYHHRWSRSKSRSIVFAPY